MEDETSSTSKMEDETSSTVGSGTASETAVEVHFVTKQTDLHVPPGYFSVPLTVGRYGLSEIVNKLTNLEPARPFDFLIEGVFLRTDLAKYLQSLGSEKGKECTEKGLTLEVVEALEQPDTEEGKPHPDWVATVAVAPGQGHGTLFTGCYDGVVRVYGGESGEQVCIGTGHRAAVKAVTSIFTPAGQKPLFASASKDRSVRLWQFDSTSKSCSSKAIITGHTEAVEALASNGTMLATAGWDTTLQVWDLTAVLSGAATADEEEGPAAKKKKSAATPSPSIPVARLPSKVFDGHSQTITGLVWPHPAAIYSASWDYSIRHWDVESGVQANVWRGNKAITSLSFSSELNLLATGHEDKNIRVWDPRLSDAEVVKSTLKSHKAWVSSVVFHPTQAHLLASASYDHTIKLWDLRANLPLHTLGAAHSDKALCVAWTAKGLASGGADCQMRTHVLKQ